MLFSFTPPGPPALLQGIISDLFPGVVLPKPDYDAMTAAMSTVCASTGLQPTDYFLLKVRGSTV